MIVDSREKGNLPKNIIKDFNADLMALGAGDYWIPKEDGYIIIERSSYSDFVGKIISGRLWEQLEKCLSKSDDVYFVLENPYLLNRSKMSYKAVIGAMASLSRKGVKLFTTRNSNETYAFIKYLYEKYNTEKKVDQSETRVKPKKMTPREQALYMLMGCNGIGEKTAKSLLNGKSLSEFIYYINNTEIDESDIDSKLHKQLIEIFNSTQ